MEEALHLSSSRKTEKKKHILCVRGSVKSPISIGYDPIEVDIYIYIYEGTFLRIDIWPFSGS